MLAPGLFFALFLALFVISAGFGWHRVAHLEAVRNALAHDRGCAADIRLSTPADEASGACRIVHGTTRHAYANANGTYGTVYDHHVVFAPQNGGEAVDADLGTDLGDRLDAYRAARDRPGAAAVVEYVDGEIDYFANDAGTIGPIVDPETDEDSGWLLIWLGVFFAVVGAAVTAVWILSGRSKKSVARGERVLP